MLGSQGHFNSRLEVYVLNLKHNLDFLSTKYLNVLSITE